jgi:hypothetical protein
VSAGHQGGVGATGGGCRADTRGGVGLTPGPGNESDRAHRPSCLSQTWITLSGRRPPPIPLPSSSRCISLEPPPRRTPGEPRPLHRKGFRTLNARPPLLILRVWHPLVGSTRPQRSSSPLSPSSTSPSRLQRIGTSSPGVWHQSGHAHRCHPEDTRDLVVLIVLRALMSQRIVAARQVGGPFS